MKLTVEATTHKLRNLLTGCGLSGNILRSNTSKSMYLDLSPDAEDNDNYGGSIKIRISDHELPPTHYNRSAPDFELGDNNMYAFGALDRYPELAAHICDRYSLQYSPTLRRILTRRKNAAQKRAEMDALRADTASARINAARPIYAAHRAEIDAQAARIATLSGKNRRRARSKFNRRWGDLAYELRQLAREEKRRIS